jgi:hypothetical protein
MAFAKKGIGGRFDRPQLARYWPACKPGRVINETLPPITPRHDAASKSYASKPLDLRNFESTTVGLKLIKLDQRYRCLSLCQHDRRREALRLFWKVHYGAHIL